MVRNKDSFHRQINGIDYYILPCSGRRANFKPPEKATSKAYRTVIDNFHPDIIHVHGTEHPLGLLAGQTGAWLPYVVSIQGLVSVCIRYLYAGLNYKELLRYRTIREWVRWSGMLCAPFRWKPRSKMELQVLREARVVLGRTLLDKAHVKAVNPDVIYYHNDELLRPEFVPATWNLASINRYHIYASAATPSYKGLHFLIKAVSLLKKEFPDINLTVPLAAQNKGHRDGYANYIESLIASERLAEHVTLCGRLTASEVASTLSRSHVFVMPSSIENSCNALCEAMLVGAPVVTSFVGGIQSLCTDCVDCLFFPTEDYNVMAEQIRRIFTDDNLALSLSERASARARLRHDPDKITTRLIDIYREVMAHW